jgi:hypothetical protein
MIVKIILLIDPKVIETDLFTKSGWLTQDTSSGELKTLTLSKDSSLKGFGSCEWTQPKSDVFLNSTSLEDTIGFILSLLRTQCCKKLQKEIQQIVDSKCAQLNSDKTIALSPNCPFRYDGISKPWCLILSNFLV